MKDKILIYIGIALLIGVLGGYMYSQSKTETAMQTGEFDQNGEPSRENCLADDCLLIDDMEYPASELPIEVQEALNEAINDEYKALSVYEAVTAKLGMVRPFSMIMGAEEQHIASLKAIYDKYGLEVPINTWPSKVSAPGTLQEACQIGVDAEIANAALYKEELLPAVKEYEDITIVFESLMSASEEKHLPSFEKCN